MSLQSTRTETETSAPLLTIGTRGSPLALYQARAVRTLLSRHHGVAEEAIAIETITTAGDRSQPSNRSLGEIGGKGLFSKEIEERLAEGAIDIAVHSAKDMATVLADGMVMPVFLEREDVRDAFISIKTLSLDALPEGAVVGTSSLRRRAQLLRARPDLQLVEFRGNLGTRLEKLERGVADATLLAAAGLNRLGQTHRAAGFLDPEIFLPAPAQGAIGIEYRQDDARVADLVAPLNHAPTHAMVTAERAMLAVLDGSCRTPIGVLCNLSGGTLFMKGEVLSPDGQQAFDAQISGPAGDAQALGQALGQALVGAAGQSFMDALKAVQ